VDREKSSSLRRPSLSQKEGMEQYLNERHKKTEKSEITELKEIMVVSVTDGAASGRVIKESSVGVV
jgi:hypothetical protein